MLNLFSLSSSLNEVFTQAQFCEDCLSGRSAVECRVFRKTPLWTQTSHHLPPCAVPSSHDTSTAASPPHDLSNKWAKGLCSGVGRAPCEKKREKSAFSKFFCSNFLFSSPPPPLLSSSLLPGQNSKIPREWKVGFRLLRVSLFINVIF